MKDGTWKLVRKNPTNGTWTVSVRKMMVAQFGEKQANKDYGSLPVMRYREGSDLMDRGEVFYFIELIDEAAPLEKTKDVKKLAPSYPDYAKV